MACYSIVSMHEARRNVGMSLFEQRAGRIASVVQVWCYASYVCVYRAGSPGGQIALSYTHIWNAHASCMTG